MSFLETKKNNFLEIYDWKEVIREIDTGCCEELGNGSYGIVYKVLCQGRYIAVKISDVDDSIEFNGCLSEGLRVMSPTSDNLSRGCGVYIDEKKWRVYTAMDYYEGGDLSDFIRGKEPILEDTVSVILYSLLQGVREMNINEMMHRDLKPQNIFLARKGCIKTPEDIKIGDFGLCGRIQHSDKKHKKHMNYNVITRWYRPLEITLQLDYGIEVDVFSIGCILIEMITKRPLLPSSDDGAKHAIMILKTLGPFSAACIEYFETKISSSEEEYRRKTGKEKLDLYHTKRRAFWENLKRYSSQMTKRNQPGNLYSILRKIPIADELKDIIMSCLNVNPAYRPTAGELLRNKFFNFFREKKKISDLPSPVSQSNHSTSEFESHLSDNTVGITDFIITCVDEFNYSMATAIMAFYVFKKYNNVVFVSKENSRCIALVIINIVSAYITDYEDRCVKFGCYLNKPKAGMNPDRFRRLLSECIDVLIKNNIIMSATCVRKINTLSFRAILLLFMLLENDSDNDLEEHILTVIHLEKLLEKFPTYVRFSSWLRIEEGLNVVEEHNKFFRENIGMKCLDMLSPLMKSKKIVKTICQYI